MPEAEIALEHDGRAEFLEVKQAKGTFTVEIQNSKIVRFAQIFHDYVLMAGMPLSD
jgi:hypothetical protein